MFGKKKLAALIAALFALLAASLFSLATPAKAEAATVYWAYCSSNTTLYLKSSSVTTSDTGNKAITKSGNFTAISGTTAQGWNSYKSSIKTVKVVNTIAPTSGDYLFFGLRNVATWTNLSYVNMSSVTSAKAMFQVSSFSNTSLISSWNMSKVTTTHSMFFGTKVANLSGLSNWNIGANTTISYMFSSCTSLTDISGISSWDTSKVKYFKSTFAACTNLTTANLSQWNTSSNTSLANMFDGCTALRTVNLSGWSVSAVTTAESMFQNCSSLTTIYASAGTDWNASGTLATSTSMFSGCTALKGGAGTAYSSSYIDKSYARIDMLGGTGGYFTAPSITITFKDGSTTLGTQTTQASQLTTLKSESSLRISSSPSSSCNWQFVGWAMSSGTSTTTYYDGQQVSPLSNLELHAVYNRALNYCYCPADASSSLISGVTWQYYYGGTARSVTLPTLYTQPDYSWTPQGWSSSSSSSSIMFSATSGSETTITPSMTTSISYLYAVYSREARLSYDGNGGTPGTMSWENATQYYVAGGGANSPTLTLARNGYTKTGHTFIKWAAGSVSGQRYDAEASFSFPNTSWESSQTYPMYAIWTPNNYTVTFKTADTTMGTQSFTYGTAQNLCALSELSNAPVSTAYWTFDGWTTDCSGATSADYEDGESVSDLTDIADGNVVLYPLYHRTIKYIYFLPPETEIEFPMTAHRTQYYRNTTASAASASSVETFGLYSWSAHGWEPLGWSASSTATIPSTSQTGTTTTYITPAAASAAPTYYALYSRTVSILYDGNGETSGTTVPTTSTQHYNAGGGATGLSMTLSSNGFTKVGGDFSEWAEGSPSGTHLSAGGYYTFPNTAWTSDSSVTMFAVWTANGTVFWAYVADNSTLYLKSSSITSSDVGNRTITSSGYFASITSGTGQGWNSYKSSITSVNVLDSIKPSSTAYLFYGLSSASSWTGLANIDMSAVSNAYAMFYYCQSLSSLSQLSSWDVSSLSNATVMFNYCTSLTSLSPLSSWNTSSLTTAYRMFMGCSNLTSLAGLSSWDLANAEELNGMFLFCSNISSLDPLSNWTVSRVADFSDMFDGCSSLTSLSGIASWNVSGATSMSGMFYGCSSLSSIAPISGWNVSGVGDMSYMFDDCTSLTSADLSSWNTSSVTTLSCMFRDCSHLTGLDISSWQTASATSTNNMLSGCSSLSRIVIGDDFASLSGAGLPTVTTASPYTGKWTDGSSSCTSSELMVLSQPALAGTWVWEEVSSVAVNLGAAYTPDGTITSAAFATSATVQLFDSSSSQIASWTQSSAWHPEDLVPGTYTLHIASNPARYDSQGDVTFRVTDAGAVQIRRLEESPLSSQLSTSLFSLIAPSFAFADGSETWEDAASNDGSYYVYVNDVPSGVISIDVSNASGTFDVPQGFSMSLSGTQDIDGTQVPYSHTWTTSASSTTSDAESIYFDYPGAYSLSITSVPAGWATTPYSATITVASDYTTTISIPSGYDVHFASTAANTATRGTVPLSALVYPAQQVTVSKQDADTLATITAGSMEVRDALGTVVATASDLSSGSATVTLAGSSAGIVYSLVEASTPDGYQPASPVSFTVYNAPTSATQQNAPVSAYDISIALIDSTHDTQIYDAAHELTDSNGDPVESWTTTQSSRTLQLEPGTYNLSTTVPFGYSEVPGVTFTVASNGTLAITSGSATAIQASDGNPATVSMLVDRQAIVPSGLKDADSVDLLILAVILDSLLVPLIIVLIFRSRRP